MLYVCRCPSCSKSWYSSRSCPDLLRIKSLSYEIPSPAKVQFMFVVGNANSTRQIIQIVLHFKMYTCKNICYYPLVYIMVFVHSTISCVSYTTYTVCTDRELEALRLARSHQEQALQETRAQLDGRETPQVITTYSE